MLVELGREPGYPFEHTMENLLPLIGEVELDMVRADHVKTQLRLILKLAVNEVEEAKVLFLLLVFVLRLHEYQKVQLVLPETDDVLIRDVDAGVIVLQNTRLCAVDQGGIGDLDVPLLADQDSPDARNYLLGVLLFLLLHLL